jgi:TolB protein
MHVSIAAGADRRLAFERNDGVHIANLEASLIRKLGDGIFPAISPDARSVVFTSVEQTGGTYIRRLCIIDIASGGQRVLSAIPSDNVYYGAWSPEGNWIAFTMRTDGLWHLGLIKADGTDFKFIKKGEQDKVTLYSPCWARDGQSIFCQDITNIYRLGLDGSVLAQWNISKIVPNGAMSGDSRIDVSPDGRHLLLSLEMDEAYDRKDWDGPVPALWSFELSTETAVRLTARNLFAWDGCWLDNANILFLSQRAGEKEAAIYRMNGKTLKRVIEDARRPSVSTTR